MTLEAMNHRHEREVLENHLRLRLPLSASPAKYPVMLAPSIGGATKFLRRNKAQRTTRKTAYRLVQKVMRTQPPNEARLSPNRQFGLVPQTIN